MAKFSIFLLVLAAGAATTATAAVAGKASSASPVVPQTTTGNILFIAPVGSKSHKNFYYGIIEALAKEGNKVTLLTPYKPALKIDNVREVVLESNDISPHMPNTFVEGHFAPITNLMSLGPKQCFDALQFEPFIDVLHKEKFDLVYLSMFMSDCFLPEIDAMKVPFVLVNPAEMMGSFSGARIGNPTFPSIDYNPMLSFRNPKTFFQRVMTTLAEIFLGMIMNYSTGIMERKGFELGLYTADTPSFAAINTNASLMIANSFRLTEHPRPYMPNILLAGGIHCKAPQPLPKDLSDWVTSSGEAGFIFFSLGSAVRPSDVPQDIVRLLVSVFGSLPQKVLWKYDLEQVEGGLPDNVKLTKWAPQQDLLGDPHMRLFMTHGGLFSTHEATFHGVPVLGLPVFGDQDGNMNKAELQGWGKKLNWHELTYDLLRDTIVDLIEDPVKREKVHQLGLLTRDRPTLPATEVAWWAGYLMRTGGARHLRSGAADLSWYELYNTDVWLVLVASTMLLLWLLLVFVRKLYKFCFGASVGKQTATKRKRQ